MAQEAWIPKQIGSGAIELRGLTTILKYVALVALSGGAMAGDYTIATESAQLCNRLGRLYGESAFDIQMTGRSSIAEVDDSIASLAKEKEEAKKKGDPITSEEIERAVKEWREERKRLERVLVSSRKNFENNFPKSLGPRGRKLTVAIWSLAGKVNERNDASDLGYAACMDFIFDPTPVRKTSPQP